jgi:hypothetical protein
MDAEGRVIREKPGNGLVSTSTFDPRKTEVCPLGGSVTRSLISIFPVPAGRNQCSWCQRA